MRKQRDIFRTRQRRGPLQRWLLALLILLGVDVAASAAHLVAAGLSLGEDPREEGMDAAVVFFNGFGGLEGLNAESHRRVSHAASLFHSGQVSNVVCVGGNHGPVLPSGSEYMYSALRRMGVPERQVVCDRVSYDTHSNWRAARRILRARHWEQAVLVSSPLHLYRIRSVVDGDGLDLRLSPSSQLLDELTRDPLSTWQALHHEWAGWLLMLLPSELRTRWVQAWRRGMA